MNYNMIYIARNFLCGFEQMQLIGSQQIKTHQSSTDFDFPAAKDFILPKIIKQKIDIFGYKQQNDKPAEKAGLLQRGLNADRLHQSHQPPVMTQRLRTYKNPYERQQQHQARNFQQFPLQRRRR
jgi:hypothetical protein